MMPSTNATPAPSCGSKRADFHKHPLDYAMRNHIIDFLVSLSFIEATGGAYDPRNVKIVRPGLPEPAIAKLKDQSAPSNRGPPAVAN
jgi:hypothetical protein